MTDKELRHLRRYELIEIIYALQENEKALQEEISVLKEKLKTRETKIAEAGSLAEVSAVINGIFTVAQRTADEYLEDIKRLRMEAQAQLQADKGPAGIDLGLNSSPNQEAGNE